MDTNVLNRVYFPNNILYVAPGTVKPMALLNKEFQLLRAQITIPTNILQPPPGF